MNQQVLNDILRWAAAWGDVAGVKEALKIGADPWATPIRRGSRSSRDLAAKSRHAEIARMLRDARSDKREDELDRLVAAQEARDVVDRQMVDAARNGQRDEVERLKPQASAKACENAENILLGVEAAARGDAQAVAAWEARQGFTDEQRETLLMTVGLTTDAMARLFIAIADDVNVRDKHGRTPLMCAAEYERLDIMRMLIDAGADIAAIDKALIRARMDGHDRAAELLKPYASTEGSQGDAEVVRAAQVRAALNGGAA